MREFVRTMLEREFLWRDRFRKDMFDWLPETPTLDQTNGLIKEYLDDPYTRVTERIDFNALFRKCGIGVRLAPQKSTVANIARFTGTSLEGYPLIEMVVPDSPAAQNGLKAGCSLVSIGGVSALGIAPEDLCSLLLGEEGSQLNLTVRHEGRHELTHVRLERTTVRYPLFDVNTNNGVCFIRPGRPAAMMDRSFSAELESALLHHQKTTVGRIIDLRDCLGGHIEAAVETISLLATTKIKIGTPLVKLSGRGGIYYKTYTSLEPARSLINQPLVILISGATISCGEIVPAALQLLKIAYLIGTRTDGKWIMQNKHDFDVGIDEKLSLYVTVANIHLSDDRWLGDGHRYRIGVKPNEIVPQLNPAARPGTDADTQYKRAVAYILQEARSAR